MVHLDYRDSRPIYAQIVDGFREQITGGVLRPGEKLYEELLLKSEGLQKTDNKLIYIGHQVMYTPAEIEEKLETLRGVLYAPNPKVRDCMLNIIKEPADKMYEPIPGAVNPRDVIEV